MSEQNEELKSRIGCLESQLCMLSSQLMDLSSQLASERVERQAADSLSEMRISSLKLLINDAHDE